MKITIVELEIFIKACKRANLTSHEKTAIIDSLASHPLSGDVMVGTGGLRKVRFSGQSKGKSGGYRVLYFLVGLICLFFL